MSDIKAEFEKAWQDKLNSMKNCCEPEPKYAAIWGALWMVERCATKICHHDGKQRVTHKFCCEHQNHIRQLAKELQ